MAQQHQIFIIAGPNGAGKTTFARQFLPQEAECPDFINVDLIAAGLSPFAPEAVAMRAGRLMLAEMRHRVKQRKSFAFETTLSGLTYARMIPRWQAVGYQVQLIFVRLDSVELAVARVRTRAKQGGHTVPEPVIRRRFLSGLQNFERRYKALADEWALYDNSGTVPVLLDSGDERR